ncbi:sce7726 family protein [Hymenobacter sp. BT186]|uniref:Sce7726 family protein n=1 Tax=Hymenobacter telluris TaxID=2816474 RepID=A0A939F0R7_9BACT|nr:sce7726 family protein [Hymenobacter telluris]MBO0360647.1 sce7726 family protein [Hymenobacter telluris]
MHETYLRRYKNDGISCVVEEMGLSAHAARIDIGVINGELVGYEIKSDRDTLNRLPGQLEVYNQIFDRITVVCGPKHLGKLEEYLPEYIGLMVTKNLDGKWELVTIRESSQNPNRTAYMIASLLWHEEAKSLLVELGLSKGLSRLRRWELWERIAENLPIDQVSHHVRTILKARTAWREA